MLYARFEEYYLRIILKNPTLVELLMVGSNKRYFPYFFVYQTGFFPFENNPKNLDLSYKTDLDFWDFFQSGGLFSNGKGKPIS